MLQRYHQFACGIFVLAASLLLSGCQPGGSDTSGGPGAEPLPSESSGTTKSPEQPPPPETESPVVDASDDEDMAPAASDESAPDDSATVSAPPGTQWGHLRGRFVFDGTPPKQKPVAVTSDVEYCGPHHPLDESLVVNANNQGLANVLVGLFLGRDDKPPAVHPAYNASATDKITIDNLKCCFVPHVVLLRTTQTLEILNTDRIAHNNKVDTFVNPPINPTLPAGGTLERKFGQPERLPARVSCSIHPWMNAWLMIRSDPYVAKTDGDGRFEIKNVPAGKWTFQVWHEKVRYVTEVERDGAQTQWAKGRFTVDIPVNGTVDMGDLKIRSELFGDL